MIVSINYITGLTLLAIRRDADGQILLNDTYEAFGTNNHTMADYAEVMTDDGSGRYTKECFENDPDNTSGDVTIYLQADAQPENGDFDYIIGSESLSLQVIQTTAQAQLYIYPNLEGDGR
jgi:hypothetical protein